MHVAGACRTWGDLNPEERSKQLLDRFKKYTQKVWGWTGLGVRDTGAQVYKQVCTCAGQACSQGIREKINIL